MEAFVGVHIPIPLHEVLIKGGRGERQRQRGREKGKGREGRQ